MVDDPDRTAAEASPSATCAGVWAHSANAAGQWHDLRQHLDAVAHLARNFAEPFGGGDLAALVGRWHDSGKYSEAFQGYLASQGSDGSHTGEAKGHVDHSSAGAQFAASSLPIVGHLLAYAVAGHHSGLLDGRADGPSLEARLEKQVASWGQCPLELLDCGEPYLPDFLRDAMARHDGFSVAFFVRMLFSCLVDADFLDTERFLDPYRARQRPQWPRMPLGPVADAVMAYVMKLEGESPKTPVNQQRSEVFRHCVAAAPLDPGLFSLTVPTGGGKTLSSLAFAVRHAIVQGLQRVIYVVPFTTIIEQNADVFRAAVASLVERGWPDLILEHHSAIDAEQETTASRLAAENWDAPVVVTTSVQFFESLFAARSSRCRKLHNLAGAVVILDEAQALPVDFLKPCLAALRELTSHYRTTVVLCTATQPAVHYRDGFDIGLTGVREIIPEPQRLYLNLRRVEVEDLGMQGDTAIVEKLRQHRQVLCIVNTRRHARLLFEALGDSAGQWHLSALMCPEHRIEVLGRIRRELASGAECRVVSTQLVEAGVDIDFPVVFRSLAGLDAIAQAAGRCNRNGRLEGPGRTYAFRSEHRAAERFVSDTASIAEQVLELYQDPLLLEAVERYFRLYYWDQSARWDTKSICARFSQNRHDRHLPFDFGFATVAGLFKLIADSGKPVIIPWRERGRSLCDELRKGHLSPAPDLRRPLQRFTVTVPTRCWDEHIGRSIELVHGEYPVLISPEAQYSHRLGLVLDGGHIPHLEV